MNLCVLLPVTQKQILWEKENLLHVFSLVKQPVIMRTCRYTNVEYAYVHNWVTSVHIHFCLKSSELRASICTKRAIPIAAFSLSITRSNQTKFDKMNTKY